MEGKPNQLNVQGMRSFEQYDETRKYFAEGKQKDNNTDEVQKHLQLHDLGMGEYLTDKYALWLDFRMTDENSLNRNIGEIHYHQENKTNEGKQIEFSAESTNLKKKSKVGINEMFSNC